jgi:hypothetical protein
MCSPHCVNSALNGTDKFQLNRSVICLEVGESRNNNLQYPFTPFSQPFSASPKKIWRVSSLIVHHSIICAVDNDASCRYDMNQLNTGLGNNSKRHHDDIIIINTAAATAATNHRRPRVGRMGFHRRTFLHSSLPRRFLCRCGGTYVVISIGYCQDLLAESGVTSCRCWWKCCRRL